MMRLERSGLVGMGICVWRKKKTREKKKKRKEKEKKRMDGWRGSKKNKKSQLNVTIIFSQYFTINFK